MSPVSWVFRGEVFHERRAAPASPVCKGRPFRGSLISGKHRSVPTRAAAQFGAGQATVAAGDGAGRGTQAGGKTQENSARLAHSLRRLHAGNGGLYAARWLYGA